DDPGVPDLVGLLVREAGQVEEVGQVLRVLGTDRAGGEEHDQTRELLVDARCGRAGEGGLILMGRRSRQLKVGSARREARVLDGKVDEEALARLARRIAWTRREDLRIDGRGRPGGGGVAVVAARRAWPRREDLQIEGRVRLGGCVLAGGGRGARGGYGREGEEGES